MKHTMYYYLFCCLEPFYVYKNKYLFFSIKLLSDLSIFKFYKTNIADEF